MERTMKILSLSEAKIKLGELVDKVQSMEEVFIITKNGRPSAVLVSPDEFNSWKETIEIKSDLDPRKEIKKRLSALKNKSKLYTLDELL
jgi:prevent-host-death family protein